MKIQMNPTFAKVSRRFTKILPGGVGGSIIEWYMLSAIRDTAATVCSMEFNSRVERADPRERRSENGEDGRQ